MALPVIGRAARRLALVGRLSETWFHRPPSPNRVILDVTRRCNLRCAMCRTWERAAAHELTASEIGGLMKSIPRLTWLDVTGGEPFVRADIEEVFGAIAKHTRALRMLHFQTNGWMSDRITRVTRELQAAVGHTADLIVTVSIDGPPQVHDRVRGREGSAHRALQTARALAELGGVDVHIGTTVSHDNVDALPALEDWLVARWPAFSRRRWHWNWVQRSAHFFGNEGLPITRPVAVADHLRKHLRRRGWPRDMVGAMETAYLVNLEAYHRGTPRAIGCEALRSTAFISPEGDVYPCHIYDRPVGNVRRQTFAEVWASHVTLEARRDVEALRCGGCFSACEAYPAMAGSPVATARATLKAAAARWQK